MKKATSTKGKPVVSRVEGRTDLFKVESQSLTLVNYLVQRTITGTYICRGNSEGQKCWPYYQHQTCKHCDAVAEFEAAERGTRKLTLQDLFPD